MACLSKASKESRSLAARKLCDEILKLATSQLSVVRDQLSRRTMDNRQEMLNASFPRLSELAGMSL